MNRFFIFLWALGSFTVLCQWYVFVTLRKSVSRTQSQMTRLGAYTVLVTLAVINLVGIELSMESRLVTITGDFQRISAVVFFSYLGMTFLLCLAFILLKTVDQIVRVAQWLYRTIGRFFTAMQHAEGKTPCVAGSNQGSIHQQENSICIKNVEANDWPVVPQAPSFQADNHSERFTDCQPKILSRRNFLKWGTISGITAGAGVMGKGLAEAYQSPVTEKLQIVHSSLSGLSRPLKLIHVTDFHFGLFYGTRELEDLVKRLNSIDGDAVVLTGDIYHSPLSPMELSTSVLKDLRSRGIGNFAVLGNHDFYAGVNRSVDSLEKASITLLRNEWMTFEEGGACLHIGGIDDPVANWLWGTEFPAFSAFVKKSPEKDGFKILLSHRPAIFPHASACGIDLVLSGHTHGGQLVIPSFSRERGYSLAGVVSPFTYGWYRMAASSMYLNRGVGLTFLPWRINCPPEIAVLQLSGTEDVGS